MDIKRDPLLAAVTRVIQDAVQRYERLPTAEHAREVGAAHRLAAAAYEALAASRPIPVDAPPQALATGGVTERREGFAGAGQDLPLLLRITEAATLLGLSRSTMYSLVNSGRVPIIRLGGVVRIPRDQLLRWIEDQARNPAQ